MAWQTVGARNQGIGAQVRQVLPFLRVYLTLMSCRMSPSSYVDRWSTPELIIHGSQDYRQ
jgi:hypothetical protein